jgi:hypothetical protein
VKFHQNCERVRQTQSENCEGMFVIVNMGPSFGTTYNRKKIADIYRTTYNVHTFPHKYFSNENLAGNLNKNSDIAKV